ncbi:hypothetical protein [Prosthecobacter sp.]|uniref:hypothetical protein n=1 Tax=Prosthecobacter sp. TaxID=1965333 RepID=UPI0025E58CFF|nr:hypothetical protein [Prosthecobacter sp.]
MTRLAFAASCVLSLALQGHTLLRPMLLTDDIAQHHVWLDAGPAGGFRGDDPWLDSAKAIQPYMTAMVFQALHLVLPTLLVGKVLALAMHALTGFLIFQIGRWLGGIRLGWLVMAFFFVSDAWIGISGGFARSFAWPLVSGFLLSVLAERRGWTAICMFLAAALYPIVFVLLCPAYGLLWLYEQMAGKVGGWREALHVSAQLRQQWPVMVAVAAGAILVLLKSHELALHPWVGPQVTLAEIQRDPLYHQGGRVPVWPPASLGDSMTWFLMPWDKILLEPVLRHAASLGSTLLVMFHVVAGILLLVALGIVFRRCRRHGFVLLALMLSAVITFEIAVVLLPRLYEPSRYLTWSLPVLAVLSVAVVLDAAFGLVTPGRVRQAGIVFVVLAIATRSTSIRGKGAEDVSEYSALYFELARTGGEELIACFPRTADFVPVLCHRSVYISNECSHGVLFTRYRKLVMERHAALVRAFYSSRQDDVRAFCADNDISWLVVEEKYYRQGMPSDVYFVPFVDHLRELLKQTPEPWLLSYARKLGKEVQPGVYLLNTAPIIDNPDRQP